MAGMLGALGSMMGISGGAATGAAAGAAGGAAKGAIGGDAGAASPATVAAPVSGAQLPSNVQVQMPTSNVPGASNPDGPIGTNLTPTNAMGQAVNQGAPPMSTMDRINAYMNSPFVQQAMKANQQQMQNRNAAMGINAGS